MWIQRMPDASMISGSATISGSTTSASPTMRRRGRGRGRGKGRLGTAEWYGTGGGDRTHHPGHGRSRRGTIRRADEASRTVVGRPPVGRSGARRDRLVGHRPVVIAVGPTVGHRPGRLLLLVPLARRSVRAVGLDGPDRVRLFAGLLAGPPADPDPAVAGVHGGLDVDPARRARRPDRAAMACRRCRARTDGARRRQYPPAA